MIILWFASSLKIVSSSGCHPAASLRLGTPNMGERIDAPVLQLQRNTVGQYVKPKYLCFSSRVTRIWRVLMRNANEKFLNESVFLKVTFCVCVMFQFPHSKPYYGESMALLVMAILIVPSLDVARGREKEGSVSWTLPLTEKYLRRNFLLEHGTVWTKDKWWTCLTMMFLHVDESHKMGNIFALILPSYFVHYHFGASGLFFIYLGAGFFTSLNSDRRGEERLRNIFHKRTWLVPSQHDALHHHDNIRKLAITFLHALMFRNIFVQISSLFPFCISDHNVLWYINYGSQFFTTVNHLRFAWNPGSVQKYSCGASGGVSALYGAQFCICAEVIFRASHHYCTILWKGTHILPMQITLVLMIEVIVPSLFVLSRLECFLKDLNCIHRTKCKACGVGDSFETQSVGHAAHVYGFLFGVACCTINWMVRLYIFVHVSKC